MTVGAFMYILHTFPFISGNNLVFIQQFSKNRGSLSTPSTHDKYGPACDLCYNFVIWQAAKNFDDGKSLLFSGLLSSGLTVATYIHVIFSLPKRICS